MNNYTFFQGIGISRLCFAHIYSAYAYQNTLIPVETDNVILEITYITKGEMLYSIGDDPPIRASENSLFCFYREQPIFVQTQVPHEHHTVGVLVSRQFLEQLENAFPSLHFPLLLTHLQERNNSFLSVIDDIIFSQATQSKGALACVGLLFELLDKIDRYVRQPSHLPYSRRVYIKQAKAYIVEHIHEPIRQHEVAAHLNLSCEYLCSIFKQVEGVAMMNFINRTKLRQMVNVMKDTRISLAEATEMYGYTDPNYVSRLYKKYFGRTITQALHHPITAELPEDF